VVNSLLQAGIYLGAPLGILEHFKFILSLQQEQQASDVPSLPTRICEMVVGQTISIAHPIILLYSSTAIDIIE